MLDTKPVASTDIDLTSPAGLHSSAITVADGADNNYQFIYVPGDFNITQAMLTVTADAKSKVYGEDNPELTLMYSGFVQGEDESVLDTKPTLNTGLTPASVTGLYTNAITPAGAVDNNYDFTYVPANFTVTKAMLTVTADSKTKIYRDDNPAITFRYSGFVLGEDESVLDTEPAASTSVTTASNSGIYTDDIAVAGAEDVNYDFTYVPADFTVEKATLTVTADNQQKVYRSDNPVLTFGYEGFVPNEDENVLDILPVATTAADATSDVDVYDIVVSGGEDNNYTFVYANGVLIIDKADQSITFQAIPSGLRTTQEFELQAEATSGRQVEFEIQTPETAELDNNTLIVLKEGDITVVATQPGDRNWNPAKDVLQTAESLATFDNIMSLFTPNNDGMNDYWYIPDLSTYGRVKVKIYNRFGKIIYSSSYYENNWNGTWEGKELPSASYYYIIESENRGIITGTVNILR